MRSIGGLEGKGKVAVGLPQAAAEELVATKEVDNLRELPRHLLVEDHVLLKL